MVQPVQPTTFTGKGKDVTPYFLPPSGISTLSVQTTAKQFCGWLYHIDDLGGGPVSGGVGGYDGRFFDFTSANPASSFPVNPPNAGPYLLSTDNVTPNDSWTFTFQWSDPRRPPPWPSALPERAGAWRPADGGCYCASYSVSGSLSR